ncbi:AraC family transcriptional regulator [Granulicella sp. dw_53]|uniref:AraC family transcriptional regulator n=1 Tax=Granulicella sp. dw_53 TaxID=2719792 RepID=UPI001BD4909E|nr:AraC family transcriptional regulator [Granulicella sp. dw_53]
MRVAANDGAEATGERRVQHGRAPGENLLLLRWPELAGVELLRADFRHHAFVPHWHDTYMIAATAKGPELMRHNRVEHVVEPGTLSMVNPGEIHDCEALDPKLGWHYRVLYLSPETIHASARELGLGGELQFERPLVVDAWGADQFLQLHKRLEDSVSRLERESHFAVGLAHLLQVASVTTKARSEVRVGASSLDSVREYLHETWAEPVALDALAKIAGLSKYHLLRRFRAQFGLPPHAYQMQLRVGHAKELIFAGMETKDVALETGFYDQAHLTNAVRRYTGVTPGRIRTHFDGAASSFSRLQ